jgi:hypothetical protein
MYKGIVSEIVKPLIRRGGTAFGVFLMTLGLGQENVDQIVLGLVTAASVSADLLVSHWARKNK